MDDITVGGYLPRDLEALVRKSSRQMPALLVTGARQVVKTTLLRHAEGD